ncbi:hypothetical protein ACQ4PT_052679 [Festuca glaucescens]
MAESSAARKGDPKDFDVQELLKNLQLHEAELNDVFLGKEEVRKWPEVKWLAAAAVLTEKSYSLESLKITMLAAWTPAREVSFHAAEKNLIVLQARCLGDWKRIMEEGPWLFRGCALMVEPFDGATMIPTVIPTKVQAWIQIHKLPPLFRNKEVLTQLASRPRTPGAHIRRPMRSHDPERGRGQQGSRGAGRMGRGFADRTQRRWKPKDPADNSSRKRNSEEAGLEPGRDDDLTDTASSPLKQPGKEGEEESISESPAAKKQLNMSVIEETVDGERVPPPPPEYVPPKIQKKRQKAAAAEIAKNNGELGMTGVASLSGTLGHNTSATKATSEEDRRAQ